MAFTEGFLDELKSRIGLADVVGRRVKLTRKGREHQGLCPFHKEKTPSFTVNEDKGFYHCFGCGAHGSVFDFVMETEGLNFPEAVEALAGQAGMEVPKDTPQERERQKRRQGLYEVLDSATRFFEHALWMPEGKSALAYLRDRGLTDQTIKAFRLGFAPNNRDAVKQALAKLDITDDQMIAAGLLKRPDDGRAPFGYFRGRVIFPISDRRGRPIAFGGRILGEGEPKYLNSPETQVFHKGATLYGLAQAMGPARKDGKLIVTEGYMDVIALAQAGFAYAVAPLGTALTEDQIQAIWKLVPEPTLCFDGDNAGARAAQRAAERALPMLRPGIGLRFAELPAGEDPDTLIKRKGPAAMQAVLDGAAALSEMLWQREVGAKRPTTPEDRAALEKRLVEHALKIQDPQVRGHFLTAFKDRLWDLVRGNRGQGGGQSGGRGMFKRGRWQEPPLGIGLQADAGRQAQVDGKRRREQVLLAMVLRHPALFDEVGETFGRLQMSDAGLDGLRQTLIDLLTDHPDLDPQALEAQVRRRGLSAVLDSILSVDLVRSMSRPGGVLAADANPETLSETWREYLDALKRDGLALDLVQGETVLDEESWARKRALLAARTGEEAV